jgi:polyhydroxybutyrate depolymerase
MKPLVTLIALMLAVTPLTAQQTRYVSVNGVRREYLVQAPRIASRMQRPLVIMFHAAGSDAHTAARTYGWLDESMRDNFTVVFPQGLHRGWNDLGRIKGDARDTVNDIAFVRAMLADLQRVYKVDPKRIYATGHSNGGFFSYALACAMPGVFAAIGPVAASMGTNYLHNCGHAEPLSVLHIHGSNDPLVPLSGQSTRKRPSLPVRETVAFWAKLAGCPTACRPGIDVTLRVVEGGRHNWPGIEIRQVKMRDRRNLKTKELDATAELWKFFATHPKP